MFYDQQVHGKILNITNHQGSTRSKPQCDITLHLLEWLSSKRPQITNVYEDVEKREPLYTVDEAVNWCSHCGNQYGGFSEN